MKKTKFRLHILMGEKKIRSISQLSQETGLSRPTLTKIYDNKTNRVEFETIERLCAFFECELKDLIELAPVEEGAEQ